MRVFAAIIRANIADRAENVVVFGDEFTDDLLAQPPHRVFVTAEKVVDELPAELRDRVSVSRLRVDGLCETLCGAGFTSVIGGRCSTWWPGGGSPSAWARWGWTRPGSSNMLFVRCNERTHCLAAVTMPVLRGPGVLGCVEVLTWVTPLARR